MTGTIAWGAALRDGACTLVAVLSIEMIAGMAWLQGAAEAGLDTPIDSTLRFFPGSVLRYGAEGAGFEFGWTPGYLCLLVGAAVVLWRMVMGRVLIPGAGRVPDPVR